MILQSSIHKKAKRFRLSPAAVSISIWMLTSCSSGASLTFDLDTVNPLVVSHAAVEELGDQEYIDYVKEAVESVVDGHSWGEWLLQFMNERGVYIPERQMQQTKLSPTGRGFWISVYTPEPGSHLFFFIEDPMALMLPKVAMGKTFLGIIVGHELQHAYDAIMFPELMELGTFKHVVLELNAYLLAVYLADNYLDGSFSETVREGLAAREYKRKNGHVLIPKRSLADRFDMLFGPPSPWEVGLRFPLYILGLSYEDCNNQLERTYSTYEFMQWAGYHLEPPGFEWFRSKNHVGLDVTANTGEEIESPIRGRIIHYLKAVQEYSEWQGIILEGIGEDAERIVRILGLEPDVEVGSVVNRGDPIGLVQNPDKTVKNIRPHLHLELYVRGVRVDANWILDERWQNKQSVLPATFDYYYLKHKGKSLLTRGFKYEEKRQYLKAIECFEEALKYGWWDISNTPIYHFIARCRAAMEDFGTAARVQQVLIEHLKMEFKYAEGGIPEPELGTIGACTIPQILRIRLEHQEKNLEAYKQFRDTVHVH